MTPKQIRVGRYYKHKQYPETVYLGAVTSNDIPKKMLVIVECPESDGPIGRVVIEKCLNPDFWKGFSLVPLRQDPKRRTIIGTCACDQICHGSCHKPVGKTKYVCGCAS